MAKITLHVEHPPVRITLKVMLEADGHRIVTEGADAAISDTPAWAVAEARERPSLLLANAGGIADAVKAMRQGVYGYIFMPLQPGEAVLMVQRALKARNLGRPDDPEKTEPDNPRLEAAEQRYILDVLEKCKHNQSKAAHILGIGRNTLWRKLKHMKKTD
jgi:DNA-binding NtrC family response regulator